MVTQRKPKHGSVPRADINISQLLLLRNPLTPAAVIQAVPGIAAHSTVVVAAVAAAGEAVLPPVAVPVAIGKSQGLNQKYFG